METLIASEITLSTIPSLIKMSPLSVPDLTLLRLIAVSLVSFIGLDVGTMYNLDIKEWLYPTIITIVHIVSSYLGFRMLPTVWSQVLFFTYPFFILVGSYVVLNKSIKLFDIMWFIPLLFSIYLLYLDVDNKENKKKQKELGKKMGAFEWSVGIVSILISALTEAAYFIYFLYNPVEGSWNRLGVSYIGAAILYTIYYLLTHQSQKHIEHKKPRNWLFAILWNIIVAGFGYWGRFYSQDKVSPLLYSALSYTGLLSGYGISVLLGQDAMTKTDIISIIGVLFSILGLTFTPSLMSTFINTTTSTSSGGFDGSISL